MYKTLLLNILIKSGDYTQKLLTFYKEEFEYAFGFCFGK